MTTATGQYVIDFTGEGAESPWVDANWTDRVNISGRTCSIISASPNYLAPTGQTADSIVRNYSYTGSTYVGSTWAIRMEVGSWTTSDQAWLSCCNSTGTGYLLVLDQDGALWLKQTSSWTDTDATISTATSWTALSSGDVLEFSITAGSPNTFAVKKNGTAHTSWSAALSDSLYTLGATATVGIGMKPIVSGVQKILSIGVDYGAATGQPTQQRTRAIPGMNLIAPKFGRGW